MASIDRSSPRVDYRPEIDGLRAIAVLSVVLFHFGWQGVSGGFLGVDVFFVISGFLITRLIVDEIVATGRFRFGNFYLRRLRRLFPALAVVLSVSSFAAFFILSPQHFRRFGEELIAAGLSVSNFLYFDSADYFDISKNFKALLHTWSLAVEEQFYLIWPLLLLAGLRWGKRQLKLLLLGTALLSLLFAQFLPDRDAAFFLTPFRVFEFAAGAAIVWLLPYRIPGKFQELLLLAGLTLIGVSVNFYSENSHLPGFLTLVPVLGSVLCIYAGGAPVTGWLLRNRLSVGLGKISYSLYLVHWPLFVFVGYAGAGFSNTQRLGLLVASLILAVLLYRFVEQPFRHVKIAGKSANRRFILGTAAFVLCGTVLGSSLTLNKGWEWRLPEEAYSLLESAKRKTKLVRPCHYTFEVADEDFENKFRNCLASSGPAVLVVGDSHAGDLFPALAINSDGERIASIWKGGCRPFNPKADCHYDLISDFVARNTSSISAIIYPQKGSYLLTDNTELPVMEEAMEGTLAYVLTLDVGVPLLWVGPHWEPRFEIDETPPFRVVQNKPFYFQNENPYVDDVDAAIQSAIDKSGSSIRFISQIDILGPLTVGDYLVDGEYTYEDNDHWSAKGEEIFGARLLAGSPLLQRFLAPSCRADCRSG